VVRSSNSGLDKRVLSSERPDRRVWVPHSLLFNAYQDSSPGVKRLGSDVDHSALPESFISSLPVCFRGMNWGSFFRLKQ